MNNLECLVKSSTSDFPIWDTFRENRNNPVFDIPFDMEDFANFVAFIASAHHTQTHISVANFRAVINRKLNIIEKHSAI